MKRNLSVYEVQGEDDEDLSGADVVELSAIKTSLSPSEKVEVPASNFNLEM